MNKELEKYIDMALIDGVITESEKAFLKKKASQLGVEEDEFEFVLNAKILTRQIEMQKSTPFQPQTTITSETNTKTNKEGVISKCPSCGAPVKSFSSKCPDCGHEFRETSVTSTVQKFYAEFQKIGERINEFQLPEKKTYWNMNDKMLFEVNVRQQQDGLIGSFPVPNTKEDIFEFLGLCLANKGDYHHVIAWKNKARQILMKAKLTFSNDSDTIAELQSIAEQLNLKWKKI